MAITYLDLEDTYKVVSDDKPVTLSVKIGDGQTGSYVVFLGKALKSTNATASLGTKQGLVGKKAIVVVTIPDTLEETNWTSTTIQLKEGTASTVFGPYKKQATKHLDTVIYTLQIIFTS